VARTRGISLNAASGPKSAVRVFFALLLLMTFSVQSYLTQTHIHFAPSMAQKQAPGKLPSKDDPANCPVCQEMMQAGHFVTPAAASLLLPSAQVSVIEIATPVAVIAQAASHAWRSRAPPQA